MSRRIIIAILIGLVGLVGGFALGRFTHIGERHAQIDAEIDKLLVRAESAFHAERFDEPRGDNVLDLTDEILAKRPDESRARALRQHAADRLVRIGLDRKAKGQLADALSAYELSAKLARPDHGLLEEIEATKSELARKK